MVEAADTRTYHQRRYAERRARLDEVKVGAGCADCGYNAHPAALQFDHLPGRPKNFNIARECMAKAWAVVESEIANCEVVCANCHAIRTANRQSKASATA